jgi:C-terminal processing protease CtpA/Prc
MHRGRRAVAALPDLNARREAINLPQPYVPTAYNASGSDDITYYTMLPDTSVGVMMLGSFSPADYYKWQSNLLEGINGLKEQGADHLIIDLSNNGGGYVCEGYLVRASTFNHQSRDANFLSFCSSIGCSLVPLWTPIRALNPSCAPMNLQNK